MLKHIKILLPRNEYSPGDEVKGRVVLNCDEQFKCKSGSFIIFGQEIRKYIEVKTKGRGKVSSSKKTKAWDLYTAKSVFAENMDLGPGKHEFHFQFQLPDDLEPSYNPSYEPSLKSYTTDIVYGINASMELPFFGKLNASKRINILNPIEDVVDEMIEVTNPDFTEKPIRVRMDSQRYCVGDDIAFSYCIATDMRFELIRAQIEHIEHFKTPKRQNTRILCSKEIPSKDIVRHKWNTWILRISEKYPVAFSLSKRFQSSLALKVTIVRKLKVDIAVRIQLISGHCPNRETGRGRRLISGMKAPSITKPEKESTAKFWYDRATTFKDKGDIAKALQSVETAIKWHPDFPEALALRDELKKP